MADRSQGTKRSFGAECQPIDLSAYNNWPKEVPQDEWWQKLADQVRAYPSGEQRSWGVPFKMSEGGGLRVVMAKKDMGEVTLALGASATHLCLLHTWEQIPSTIRRENPSEGLVIGEYVLTYGDGSRHVQPVRARFEVQMAESPGPPWLAVPFLMWTTVDPAKPTAEMGWGVAQYALYMGHMLRQPPIFHYALPNPHPEKRIKTLAVRGLQESPLIVAGLTLYRGSANPLRHLPRRMYRVAGPDDAPTLIEKAEVDLGSVARIEHTLSPRDEEWLKSPYVGTTLAKEPERGAEDLIEVYGAEDATVSVVRKGETKPLRFSLGKAFHEGRSASDGARLEVLGKDRQWMQVRVIDSSTGKPTPVRIHFSGPRGEYLAPYGHHAQINANWFEDYGADILVGGRSYAYILGECTSDMPVGDVYVEIYKGFEYEPVRKKVTIKPGQKTLELSINRWKDLRSAGWVTADTHVHFVSPQTAWLEAQAEGVNVVNLLASQWGRLFTNVGDYTGRVGVVEDDTIVYVGTENRNHMLGHMSMLGTKGLPVFPMCGGGPTESWVSDPDFRTMAEWARENRSKGGVVIRPHFPYCGFTEDPVPIIKGLVHAVEIRGLCAGDFATQEWYRYLNCGYPVAVVGGTDKMSAGAAIGWLRTYAKLDPNKPFTYDAWAEAIRAGRTVSTTGALMDLSVDGKSIGEKIAIRPTGGTLEVHATAESFFPLGKIELVCNGRVVAAQESTTGARKMEIREKVRMKGSGWIAARCSGLPGHPGSYAVAHTSPVYVVSGDARLFDGPAAEHMLALVEGGIEYLNTLATVFDEASRKRMVKLYEEVRRELKDRLAEKA